MYLNETNHKVHTGKHMSDAFCIQNILKQRDLVNGYPAFGCLHHVEADCTADDSEEHLPPSHAGSTLTITHSESLKSVTSRYFITTAFQLYFRIHQEGPME
jgi:hypothetical protein